jgi:hypothetical protein
MHIQSISDRETAVFILGERPTIFIFISFWVGNERRDKLSARFICPTKSKTHSTAATSKRLSFSAETGDRERLFGQDEGGRPVKLKWLD